MVTLADPMIFLDRETQWEPLEQVTHMRHNFRSRPELLGATNFVFRDLMQNKEAAEIEYSKKHYLEGRRVFPPAVSRIEECEL